MKKKTTAEIKCLSINTLHEHAKTFYEYEKAHFAQFIGKNIFKVDGSIKQKFEHESMKAEGQLPDGTFYNVHYWFECRHGYFDMKIKSCINGGKYDDKTYFCQYDDLQLTLFKTNEQGELQPIENDLSYLDARYSAEELTKIAKDIEGAAKVYEKELSRMPYQFREIFYLQRLSH